MPQTLFESSFLITSRITGLPNDIGFSNRFRRGEILPAHSCFPDSRPSRSLSALPSAEFEGGVVPGLTRQGSVPANLPSHGTENRCGNSPVFGFGCPSTIGRPAFYVRGKVTISAPLLFLRLFFFTTEADAWRCKPLRLFSRRAGSLRGLPDRYQVGTGCLSGPLSATLFHVLVWAVEPMKRSTRFPGLKAAGS